MRGSGSKTLLRNFGTLYGDAIDSSDPNTHSSGDPFPPDSLRPRRPQPVVFGQMFCNPTYRALLRDTA